MNRPPLPGGEPIAVVGMAGRFPGAPDLDAFWDALAEGREGVRFFSDEELAAAGVPAGQLGDPRLVKAAPVLEDVESFDAGFFGMTGPEADITDPQQRIFLECAWEALEDSGVDPRRAGGQTGVFAGTSLSGYLFFNLRHTFTVSEGGFQSLIGNDKDYLASHTSYKLDLRGPSVGVQTACSTSLVAVHLASQSLLNGEVDLALAGGVTVKVPHLGGYLHQEGGVFSPDGHCRPFSAEAAGTIFGSGAGVVVLRRLEDALDAGDRVYAVIRGSAVNNDGARKVGFTAPGEDGQVRALSEALEIAEVEPGSVRFVETHGTGTALGDPIEVAALNKVYGADGGGECLLGAVKSNVGHLESAAGVAGLIKAILAVHHGQVPPTLHFDRPNPRIDFASSRFRVATELTGWPGEGPRRAGVSSFGIGGTNAHLVLEEAPAAPAAAEPSREATGDAAVLTVSARHPDALRQLAGAYAERLEAAGREGGYALAAAAAHRRQHLDHRLALPFRPGDPEAAGLLRDYAAGHDAAPPLAAGRVDPERRPRLVFVFPGQGSQWVGMGRELMDREPVFHSAVERCDTAIRSHASWSLLDVLAEDAEESRLGELDVVQPTLFAIEVALAELWRSWGVEPDAVIGHSMGEVAAAHVAGALSLDDAARVICRRSRLALRVRGCGAMAVVELPADELEAVVAGSEGQVTVAAHNSPRSTVLSGDADLLRRIIDGLEARDVYCRFVKVDFASHSPQVDPLLPDLAQILDGLAPRDGEKPIYSTVAGEPISGGGMDADYWVRNLRQPVLLREMVARAVADGHDHFLEISPNPVLLPSLADCLDGDGTALPSLRREQDERATLLETLASLHVHGCPVDWDALYPSPVPHVSLPLYPWQRQRHWIDAADAPTAAEGGATGGHPLLGQAVASSLDPGMCHWQRDLGAADVPQAADFRVHGHPALPAALCAEAALTAARGDDGPPPRLRALRLAAPLPLPDGRRVRLQMAVAADPEAAGGARRLQLAATTAEHPSPWTPLLRASVEAVEAAASAEPCPSVPLDEIRQRCADELPVDALYRTLARCGVSWGPSLRPLAEAWRGEMEALGRLGLEAKTPEADGSVPASSLFAAAGQLLAAAAGVDDTAPPFLPSSVGSLAVHGSDLPPGGLWGHARLSPDETPVLGASARLHGTVVFCDADGHRFAELSDVECRWFAEHWLYGVDWEETPARPEVPAGALQGHWLVFRDRGGLGRALEEALAAAGAATTAVVALDSPDREGATVLPPGDGEAFARGLAELAPEGGWRGAVYLWAADAGPEGSGDAAALAGDGLLHAAQSLATGDDPPPLWVVTRGARHREGDAAPSEGFPGQALVEGLAAAIATEHPELTAATVDLSPAPGGGGDPAGEAELASLLRDLAAGVEAGERLALRGGRRLAARLVPNAPMPPGPPPVRGDATYLVAGGLGGLGRSFARWLVENGARHLALLGRSAPTPEGEEAVSRLRAAGAEVRILRADVSDAADLARAWEDVEGSLPPLAGIIHAAGVREDEELEQSLLAHQTPERFRRILGAKMDGAWNLHRLAGERGREPLDLFVLCSSVATLFGSLGQAGYAAANSFLDGLAAHRRALGLPALAVDWGPWGEVGMAAGAAGNEEYLAYEGLSLMAPDDALAALGRLLADPGTPPRVAVMAFRQPLWQRSNPGAAAAPLFSRLATGAAEGAAADLAERLAAATPDERQSLIELYLVDQVADSLRIAGGDVDPRASLGQMGLSSLRSLEVRNRLEAALGLSIPIVQFLKSESLRAFAEELAQRLAIEKLLEDVASSDTTAGEDEEWTSITI